MTTKTTRTRMDALLALLRDAGPCAVAVSGGLDSRLMASLALEAGVDAVCVHFAGVHVARAETEGAVAWLEGVGARYEVLEVDPLAHPAVAMNRRDRCYHCKRSLFEAMAARASGRVLVDGSNVSDRSGYRPGLRALAELGVRSPLAECGVDKAGIVELAKLVRLCEPEQPSTPCLLTRLPYDTEVRAQTLALIAELETKCRAAGFTHFRVRLVDGSPILFAHPRHISLNPPLPVQWTETLSGYWDTLP